MGVFSKANKAIQNPRGVRAYAGMVPFLVFVMGGMFGLSLIIKEQNKRKDERQSADFYRSEVEKLNKAPRLSASEEAAGLMKKLESKWEADYDIKRVNRPDE